MKKVANVITELKCSIQRNKVKLAEHCVERQNAVHKLFNLRSNVNYQHETSFILSGSNRQLKYVKFKIK